MNTLFSRELHHYQHVTVLRITPKSSLTVHFIQIWPNLSCSPSAPDYISLELQLSITGMTVGPTLGPEHCIIEQQEAQALPHSDSSYRRSLLVEVRGREGETAQSLITASSSVQQCFMFSHYQPRLYLCTSQTEEGGNVPAVFFSSFFTLVDKT